MADFKDPYRTLGVAKNASADEIRSAYRNLARQNHPDLKPGDRAAEERFKAISAANDILGDAKKRALFDEFGESGLREGFNAEQARAYGAYAGGAGGAQSRGGGFGFDMGDLFGDFFGGRGQAAPTPGRDLSTSVELDLAEALLGKEVVLQLPVPHPCGVCSGSGRRSGGQSRRCATCRGSGQVDLGGHPGMPKTRCPSCQGQGRQSDPCPGCEGSGQVTHTGPVTLRIPKGAADGDKLRVAGRGEPGRGGPGDLLLGIRVRPHPFFRRDGLNLILSLPLTVAEALCGTQVSVPTLTGSAQLKIPAGTQSGTRLRMRNKGVVRGSKQGDLLVEIFVRVPEHSNAEAEAAARALEGQYETPVRAGLKL